MKKNFLPAFLLLFLALGLFSCQQGTKRDKQRISHVLDVAGLSSRYELRLHLPSDERHRHGRNHAECTDSRRLPG